MKEPGAATGARFGEASKVRAFQNVRGVPRTWLASQRKGGGSVPLTAALMVLLAVLLAFVCPAYGATARADKIPNGVQLTWWEWLGWFAEWLAVVVTAVGISILVVVKHFPRYKGLQHVLWGNGYAWLFVGFAAAVTLSLERLILMLVKERVAAPHFWLVSGHIALAGVVPFGIPGFLAKVEKILQKTLGGDPGQSPDTSFAFDAMHACLRSHEHGQKVEWAHKYSLQDLKPVARMLAYDMLSDGIIPQEEHDRRTEEVEKYRECDDPFEAKYRLLNDMLKWSSFTEVRARLKSVGK